MPSQHTLNLQQFRIPERQHGFTLVEALIAIAVLGFGFATTMAFHGELLGSAGENRMRSAAMSFAEAKVEELRAQQFDTVVSGDDTRDIGAFGFFSLRDVSLNRCWEIIDSSTTSKQVRVAVSRGNDSCSPWADTALVTLTTRLARNDYAQAGEKTLLDGAYDPDGLGEIIQLDPEQLPDLVPGAPVLPGGFEAVEYDGGFALCDPSSGKCLVPNNVEGIGQQFATINGNVFISGRNCDKEGSTVSETCGITIATEGNALCRLHYPLDASGIAAPTIPTLEGAASASVITYSCVVADQWRRSIGIEPTAGEKVCNGNPGLIFGDLGDSGDELQGQIRFYDGRQTLAEDDEGNVIDEAPHGVKGGPLTGPLQASIGSVCLDNGDPLNPEPCWSDTASRGLVPGGHHFLVMLENGGRCSDRMSELAALDDPAGPYFAGLFARNPDIFYCTSAKSYNGDFCTGVTMINGFLDNQASPDVVGSDLIISTLNAQLADSCSFFGAFGESGGGYNCAVRHPSIPTVSTESRNPVLTFDPLSATYLGLDAPSVSPLDITLQDFAIIDAAVPPTAIIDTPIVCTELRCPFNGGNSLAGSAANGNPATITYFWSFGDGNTSTLSNPTHIYAAGRSEPYTVTLTVTSNLGLADSTSVNVPVTGPEGGNNAPTASFSSTCIEGTRTCTFTSTSTDPDGNETINFHEWEFGDSTPGESGIDLTSVEHTFPDEGTEYTVSLKVTDEAGVPALAQETIQFTPPPPATCDVTVVVTLPKSNWSRPTIDGTNCTGAGTDYSCFKAEVLDGGSVVIYSAPPNKNSQPIDDTIVVNCGGSDAITIPRPYRAP